MAGISDLATLLKEMSPRLSTEFFVFACVTDEQAILDHYKPWAVIREEEGTTVILPVDIANKLEIEYEGEYARITLTVHSSLQAVGLTAEVANALRNSGISANIVAGFYHDHIFVPKEKAKETIESLRQYSAIKKTYD